MSWLTISILFVLFYTFSSQFVTPPGEPEPLKRARRFLNAQEYMEHSDVPGYLVRINRKDVSSEKKHTMCAGSIISKKLVLTSGGCLHEKYHSFDKEKRLVPIWQIEVVAGEFNTTNTDSTKQIRTPIQIYTHPLLKMTDQRKMWQNDIAILQVDEDFLFDNKVYKVDLWLSYFAANQSNYEFYTMLRASGYGDRGSPNSIQYDNLFDTSYPFERQVPQYQYLAYADQGRCLSKYTSVSDVEKEMVTYRPNAVNQYSAKPLLTAKRCFYTSSVGLAGYVPTVGDYGGPITWKSRDNNIEYLVMLVPWEPESKATFESDMNYVHWGELLNYYTDFIGKVFDAAAATSKADHYPLFTPTTKTTGWKTFTQTLSLDYFGNYQYYVRFSPTSTSEFVQVNITLSGENAAYTLRNSVVNVRDSQSKKVLKQFLGLQRSVTETVTVTSGEEGTSGERWGCTLKSGVVYTDPPTQDSENPTVFATESVEDGTESITEDIYTCEDAPVNSDRGTLNTASSFVLKSYWETVFYNSTGKAFEIEFAINRPRDSGDKGTITLTVDYLFLNKNEFVKVNESCDAGHMMCDDELSCVHPDVVCDQDPDCFDGNDENSWCLHKPCLYSQYQCTTGECVDLRVLCDGKCDCIDHVTCEDETLLCDKSPLDMNMLPQFLLDRGAMYAKIGEADKTSTSDSGAGNFEISLNLVLFLTFGLCYVFQ